MLKSKVYTYQAAIQPKSNVAGEIDKDMINSPRKSDGQRVLKLSVVRQIDTCSHKCVRIVLNSLDFVLAVIYFLLA